MPHRIIENEQQRAAFIRLVSGLKLPVTFDWRQGRDRSGQQNRLQWLWAGEVADQRGDVTADDVQCEWKLYHGVPILRAESAEFCETYDRCIKGNLTNEQKLKAMRLIDVTSIMTVRQMVRFLDTIERECIEQGFHLTQPDRGLREYLERYSDRRAA